MHTFVYLHVHKIVGGLSTRSWESTEYLDTASIRLVHLAALDAPSAAIDEFHPAPHPMFAPNSPRAPSGARIDTTQEGVPIYAIVSVAVLYVQK